jgi:hypothetical protein
MWRIGLILVAAAAALVRQYRPALSARDVAARLLATADPAPAGPDSQAYGRGVLNPYRAVVEPVAGPAVQATSAAPASTGAGRAGNSTVGAAAAERRTRRTALVLAGVGLGLAGTFALAASAVAHGRRRRWRPGTPDATTR